jgi:hypothetical protein
LARWVSSIELVPVRSFLLALGCMKPFSMMRILF